MKVSQLNSSAVIIIRKGRQLQYSQKGWWEGLGTVSERRRLSNKPKLQKKKKKRFKGIVYPGSSFTSNPVRLSFFHATQKMMLGRMTFAFICMGNVEMKVNGD